MKEHFLKESMIADFRTYLVLEEKSTHTVEKYLRDVRTVGRLNAAMVATRKGRSWRLPSFSVSGRATHSFFGVGSGLLVRVSATRFIARS